MSQATLTCNDVCRRQKSSMEEGTSSGHSRIRRASALTRISGNCLVPMKATKRVSLLCASMYLQHRHYPSQQRLDSCRMISGIVMVTQRQWNHLL